MVIGPTLPIPKGDCHRVGASTPKGLSPCPPPRVRDGEPSGVRGTDVPVAAENLCWIQWGKAMEGVDY